MAGRYQTAEQLAETIGGISPRTVRILLATVSAQVVQQGGREFLAAAAENAVRRVVFFIRYYPGLTVTDRVTYDGRNHDIVEVREIRRRDGVELHCEAAG